jgi:hypothetical protein
MAEEDPSQGKGCWPFLLTLSLIGAMISLWASQRSVQIAQQSIQRNIQLQQQQQELRRAR